MSRPGIYNENANRACPFQYPQTLIPDSVIVDFGCVMGIQSDYDEAQHDVWLHCVRRTGGYYQFVFRTNAASYVAQRELIFTRERTDEPYEIEYTESWPPGEISVSEVEGETCAGDELWEGFLVTGSLEGLDLNDGEELFGHELIEPALIQNLGKNYLRSIYVCNTDRTRAAAPDDCRSLCWPEGQNLNIYTVQGCITGSIHFKAGYNCQVEQDPYTNTLKVSAGVGAGEGEPPQEAELFPEEEAADGRSFYDGSLSCSEVIRSLNGIGGPIVELVGGQGVTIESYPESHLIVVGVTMVDLAGCLEQEASTNLPPLEYDPDPCACGPE